MRAVALASEIDMAGWRAAARSLLADAIPPQDVVWRVGHGPGDLFAATAEPGNLAPSPESPVVKAPRAFVDLAETAILHRDPERFALLYRILWRARAETGLMAVASDPDVARAAGMAKSVRRDEHKMHAFVRFRELRDDESVRFVAWFEPEHHIVERAAGFFARRFASMRWSILTPERCAHWDGAHLSFTDGATRADAPDGDPLEETWRRYYASIFNPARLKPDMMRSEMPQKYWRNLPEAALIAPLIAAARAREAQMIAAPPSEPPLRRHRAEPMIARPSLRRFSDADLDAAREEALGCRACPLWKPATQTVFGEGPRDADLVFVGEQAGDQEDLTGRPFVGPAGQVFDRALSEAGIERSKAYVTNAVKHFKFVPRGKRRIHQKPITSEINACRPWLTQELALIRPKLVVAMGATALQALLGKAVPVGAHRGRLTPFGRGGQLLATVHPSYLLRLPDEEARRAEYARFVDDLRTAAAAGGRAAA